MEVCRRTSTVKDGSLPTQNLAAKISSLPTQNLAAKTDSLVKQNLTAKTGSLLTHNSAAIASAYRLLQTLEIIDDN